MKRFYLLIACFFCLGSGLMAQALRFYPSNLPKIVIQGNDTLPYGFSGGIEAPQFSTIHLNRDSSLDLLVFDRAGNTLYPFLNAGTFKTTKYIYAPQYTVLFPQLQNFVTTYDYNNDGRMDVFTANGAGGLMVFKNVSPALGQLAFEEVYANPNPGENILMSLNRPASISTGDTLHTNVYVANNDIPAFFDLDNDGDMDIVTADPLGNVILHQNVGAENYNNPDTLGMELVDLCWGSFFSTNQIEYTACSYGKYYKQAHNGTTLLAFDNDADGDYDLLMGDVSKDYMYFIKNGKKEFAYPYDTMVADDTSWPDQVPAQVTLFPAAYYIDINNDGIKDLLVAPNEMESSKSKNQVLTYHNVGANNSPFFEYQYDDFIQNMMLDLGTSASPGFLDVDGDGDLDLLVSTEGDVSVTNHAKDRIVLFERSGPSSKPFYRQVNDDYMNISSQNISYSRMAIGDIDGDNKKDILLGDYSGRIHFLKNIKTGTRDTFQYITSYFDSIDVGNNCAPTIGDVDGDGKVDLLCGNYVGRISYLRNVGTATQPHFEEVTNNFGGIYTCVGSIFRCNATPVLADLDTNGQLDLVVGDYLGRVRIYPNFGGNLGGTFSQLDDSTLFFQYGLNRFAEKRFGLRAAPAIAKIDDDNLPDMIVGSGLGGLYYCGTYSVVPDTAIPDTTVGIREINPLSNRVSIYPNPSEYYFWLAIEGRHENLEIDLFNMEGRSLYSGKLESNAYKTMIPVYELSNGMYILSVKENNSSPYYVRVLVKHP